jgi:hypothetical protein
MKREQSFIKELMSCVFKNLFWFILLLTSKMLWYLLTSVDSKSVLKYGRNPL